MFHSSENIIAKNTIQDGMIQLEWFYRVRSTRVWSEVTSVWDLELGNTCIEF